MRDVNFLNASGTVQIMLQTDVTTVCFFLFYCSSLPQQHGTLTSFQCSDNVGWATGRASSL